MEFYPEKRLLLDQGWALAYCHIRLLMVTKLTLKSRVKVEISD